MKWPIAKRKLSAAKTNFKCKGGALDGQYLYLTTAGTVTFELNGQKGYYNNEMEWITCK